MNSQQVRETLRLLPSDSPVYRPDPTPARRGRKVGPMRASERWSEGMTAPNWGWRVAYSHFTAGKPLPATIQDRAIRRAYFFLRGAPDENMAITHSLLSQANSTRRFVLQGFLAARDISMEGIAHLLGLHREIIELYEALFFSVRSRDSFYLSGLLFPITRIGAVREVETGPEILDQLLLRTGRDYGWKEVARLAGIIPVEDEEFSTDRQVEQLEHHITGNARMLARAGYLNRPNSMGLQHVKPLMAGREKKEPEKSWDERDHLSEMSMSRAINTSFMALMRPDLDRRLALQRELETDQATRQTDPPPANGN